jgi:oligosaccharide repeat unit polymerase
MRKIDLKYIFLIPSFYALTMWIFWLSIFFLSPISWNPLNEKTILFISVFIIFSVLSCLFSLIIYQNLTFETKNTFSYSPYIFMVIGFFGNLIYLSSIISQIGGLEAFFSALTSSSADIRSIDSQSIGVQISYFGWVSCGIFSYLLAVQMNTKKTLNTLYLFFIFIQIMSNLLYIDRTRPLWIGFSCFCIFLFFSLAKTNFLAVLRKLISAGLLGIAIFIGIALWVGKIYPPENYFSKNDTENRVLLAMDAFLMYGTGSFAYLNEVLLEEPDMSFQRTFYPILKLGSNLGVNKEPVSQILEFKGVPHFTNVSTSLEPYYQDGGEFYLLISIFGLTFLLDIFSYYLLRKKSPISIYLWSNLCFSAFISFFVPKLTSFPIYLFIFLFLLEPFFVVISRQKFFSKKTLSFSIVNSKI